MWVYDVLLSVMRRIKERSLVRGSGGYLHSVQGNRYFHHFVTNTGIMFNINIYYVLSKSIAIFCDTVTKHEKAVILKL